MTDTEHPAAPLGVGRGDRVTLTIAGTVSWASEDYLGILLADDVPEIAIARDQWDAIKDKTIKPYVKPLQWQVGDVVGFYDPQYLEDMTVVRREDGRWHPFGAGRRFTLRAGYNDFYINERNEDGKLDIVICEGRLMPVVVDEPASIHAKADVIGEVADYFAPHDFLAHDDAGTICDERDAEDRMCGQPPNHPIHTKDD